MPLSPSSIIWYQPDGWLGNCRSGISLATRHTLVVLHLWKREMSNLRLCSWRLYLYRYIVHYFTVSVLNKTSSYILTSFSLLVVLKSSFISPKGRLLGNVVHPRLISGKNRLTVLVVLTCLVLLFIYLFIYHQTRTRSNMQKREKLKIKKIIKS